MGEHVFVEREWLESELKMGKSFEQIAGELGRHGSTVAYWAQKHGLRSAGATRYAARGAPDRDTIERLAAEGTSLRELAEAVDRSISTVRYWLGRWGIDRKRPPGKAPTDPATAPDVTEMTCARHGRTKFRLEGRGYYRCLRCRQERVSEWRRRVKRRLIEEAGGRCALCGYDRCPAALQFHHVDPATKSFALSRQGVTRSFAETKAETLKCVLLCANCHAEVEIGYASLPAA
jgi:transposase